jgi:hypothetical protein
MKLSLRVMASVRKETEMRRIVIAGAVGIGLLLGAILASAGEQRMVRIGIYDDTEARRIPEKAELWLKGAGSVWLQQKCDSLRNGSLSCGPLDLGMRPVGEMLELYVYVNGRTLDASGRETDELKVPFKLTAEMCAPGCARDRIIVAISDTTIEVYGAPLQAAGLKDIVKEKRK